MTELVPLSTVGMSRCGVCHPRSLAKVIWEVLDTSPAPPNHTKITTTAMHERGQGAGILPGQPVVSRWEGDAAASSSSSDGHTNCSRQPGHDPSHLRKGPAKCLDVRGVAGTSASLETGCGGTEPDAIGLAHIPALTPSECAHGSSPTGPITRHHPRWLL